MNKEDVRDIMKNELRCVQRASAEYCDRDCAHCDLLRDTLDIIQAYEYVIKMLGENLHDQRS